MTETNITILSAFVLGGVIGVFIGMITPNAGDDLWAWLLTHFSVKTELKKLKQEEEELACRISVAEEIQAAKKRVTEKKKRLEKLLQTNEVTPVEPERSIIGLE